MAEIVGTGDFKYRIIENWAKLPDGWSFKEVAAVGVDNKDNVYAFNRGEHPVMVFDRDGNFLRSWGEGQYPRAHGVHMGPDDSIYLDRRWRPYRAQMLAQRQVLSNRRPWQAAPYTSGRARSPLYPHRLVAEGRDLRLRRLWQCQGAQILARWQIAYVMGRAGNRRGRVQYRGQYLPPTPRAGSMSPTARTTASRCSTATANTRPNGTICIGRAGSTWTIPGIRSAISANSGRRWRSI